MPTGNEIVVTVEQADPVDVTGGDGILTTVVAQDGDVVTVDVTSVGDRGPKGDLGPANTLAIGTVVAAEEAAATITGTAPNQTLNLELPRGLQGIQGPAGTVTVGTVTTGGTASVTNSGTASAAVLDFVFPDNPIELPIAISDVASLQAALDAKANASHDHAIEEVVGLEAAIALATTLTVAPASASATGTAGQLACDANYLYVAVATNSWKRIPLEVFSGGGGGGITIGQQPQNQTAPTSGSWAFEGNWTGTAASYQPHARAFVRLASGTMLAVNVDGTNRFHLRRSGVWETWDQTSVAGWVGLLTRFPYLADTPFGVVAAADREDDRLILPSVPESGNPEWQNESALLAPGPLSDTGAGYTGLAASATTAVLSLRRTASVAVYGGSVDRRTTSTLSLATRVGDDWYMQDIDGTRYAWHDVRYGGGRFLAVGEGGTTTFAARCAYSTDGLTWTARDMPAGLWTSVAYGNGAWVAVGLTATSPSTVGESGGVYDPVLTTNTQPTTRQVAVSTTGGSSWTVYPTGLPIAENWRSVWFHSGRFYAFAATSQFLAHSADGVAWTVQSIPTTVGTSPTPLYHAASDGADLYVPSNVSTSYRLTPGGTGSATFSVEASITSGTLSYQWVTRPGPGSTVTQIPGATASSVTVTGLTAADNGRQYACLLTRTGGDLAPGSSVQLYTNWATLTVI